MIVIVNYGMGNVGSILNMLKHVGAEACVSSLPGEISRANKIILPGVGAFDRAMKALHHHNLIEVLNKRVCEDQVPTLGICLGMQLLTRGSEEGSLPGLGWIPAEVKKFSFSYTDNQLRIPHMGWNTITLKQPHKLFNRLPVPSRFYFVHSYHAVCDLAAHVIATSSYGIDFACAIGRDNIIGVQFHPEKSHRFGINLFHSFAKDI